MSITGNILWLFLDDATTGILWDVADFLLELTMGDILVVEKCFTK